MALQHNPIATSLWELAWWQVKSDLGPAARISVLSLLVPCLAALGLFRYMVLICWLVPFIWKSHLPSARPMCDIHVTTTMSGLQKPKVRFTDHSRYAYTCIFKTWVLINSASAWIVMSDLESSVSYHIVHQLTHSHQWICESGKEEDWGNSCKWWK